MTPEEQEKLRLEQEKMAQDKAAAVVAARKENQAKGGLSGGAAGGGLGGSDSARTLSGLASSIKQAAGNTKVAQPVAAQPVAAQPLAPVESQPTGTGQIANGFDAPKQYFPESDPQEGAGVFDYDYSNPTPEGQTLNPFEDDEEEEENFISPQVRGTVSRFTY